MIVLSLVVVGVAGYLHLDVDRFPSVDLPTVRVSTRLPGASPAEMESQVSQPIEEVLNTIEGIQELRSINGSGSAFTVVTFNLNRDIDSAAQDVRDRVATVVRDLPRDTDPPTIAKSDTDQSPILTHRTLGQPLAARAVRDCGQDCQEADRALGGRGAGGPDRRVGARDQCLGGRRPAGRLSAPHHRGARRGGASKRKHPGRQRHGKPARANVANHGAAAGRPRLQ